jgi:hypothetical protein
MRAVFNLAYDPVCWRNIRVSATRPYGPVPRGRSGEYSVGKIFLICGLQPFYRRETAGFLSCEKQRFGRSAYEPFHV